MTARTFLSNRLFLNNRLFRPAALGLALVSALGACSNGDDGGEGNTGGTSNSGGQAGSGGGQGPSGGASSGGGGGGGPSNAGGASSGGQNGQTGGGPGAGGDANGGDGSGGAASGECTRELLDGLLDDYFAALSAGDPEGLPLADDVKFTENAAESEVGATDFWENAGDAKYSQRALDTQECAAAAQAVVPEGSTDLPIAVRLKVEGAEITEIETIVVRSGDYTASFAVPNNTAAIIDIAEDVGWHDVVPEGPTRATREELIGWMDTYFSAFPNGVCDVTNQCKRLENGGGNFDCVVGASCSGTSGTGFEPRVLLADVERGIAVGFTIFDFMTDGHLDMHMMKMHGGEVHAVHAILRDTNGMSGWE